MAMSCQVWFLAGSSTVARAVRVPSARQVSSSFLRNWKVWSGLLRSNGLVGKSAATSWSSAMFEGARRSTKFGREGEDQEGRRARVVVVGEAAVGDAVQHVGVGRKLEPVAQLLVQIDPHPCFLYPVLTPMPPSFLTRPDT